MEDNYLAFLDVIYLDDNAALRGGCLVTDLETRPQEFRCTSAIRPTELQRVLYGRKLMEYVCMDLVGIPMVKAIKLQPSITLVRNLEFLKIRPRVAIPILLVETSPDGNIRGLIPFQGYSEEANSAKLILKGFTKEDILEPFTRVRNALEEAHRQKVGDPKS